MQKEDDYYFIVKQYTIKEVMDEKVYEREVVGLGLMDSKEEIIYPLPITKFLEQYRNSNGSISSQKNAAECVKRFLNYCRRKALGQVEGYETLQLQGIQGLRLEHASNYITSMSLKCRSGELDATYVKSQIRYLNKFYYYLQSDGIITEDFQKIYKEISSQDAHSYRKSEKKIYVEKDIFKQEHLGTVYPPRKSKKRATERLKDFGEDRYLLTKEFIEIAEEVSPDIVVGLYLQFFGGLRRGEVVNLTRSSMKATEDDSYIVDIDDRRDVLFPGKKNSTAEQVKVPRYQGLIINPPMKQAIEKQLTWLKKLTDDNKLKNKEAFLVNEKTHEVISGSSYQSKFNKVRDTFLKRLSEKGRYKHFIFLSSKNWSTHIGRGCFTNFCLDIGMTVGEVAVARGDSSPLALMDYIEEKVAEQTLRNAMNHIAGAFENLESNEQHDNKMKSVIHNDHIKRVNENYGI